MIRKYILYSILTLLVINVLYPQSFMEIIEKNNLSIGNEISEYDYYSIIQNNQTRYISLTNNNQMSELIRLKIDNILIDISINSNRIITRISSEDINIIGPNNLKVGDSINDVYNITDEFYYNNGYLGLYAKINDNWIIVFGENENIKGQNLEQGYFNNDRIFVVREPKPDSIILNISEYNTMRIKYIVYQKITENNIYYTRIIFE